MKLCRTIADASGNRKVNDANGQVTFRDVHYTCEVDNKP
jgi:hypothetical protein